MNAQHKELILRGAIVFLSRALVHTGNGHPCNEFGNGKYCSAPVQAAGEILRVALWHVNCDLDRLQRGVRL